MNKSLLIIFGIGVVIVGAVAITQFKKGATNSMVSLLRKEITVGTDVCGEFPKEWVAKNIGKPITKTESFHSTGTNVCQYFGTDTSFVSIKYENLSVENIKKGQELLDRTVQTDSRIPMEHFIAMQKDGLINSIYLVINPNMLVAIDRGSGEILINNDKDIEFAGNVATRLKNGENTVASTTVPTDTQKIAPLNQKALVESFLEKIGEKKIPEAIAMMSPSSVGDESQKQAWSIQLAAFQKLVVKSVEPSMPEEWTNTTQSYKVTIDVEMTAESANGPIPYYGYEKGSNIRWIVLNKIGNDWKIQGIATGP